MSRFEPFAGLAAEASRPEGQEEAHRHADRQDAAPADDGAPGAGRTYTFLPVAECNMCRQAAPFDVLGLRLDRSQGARPRGLTGIATTVCRCRTCGLVFCNPQPMPQSIEAHYGLPPESYWNTVEYDPEPGYFQRQIDAAKELLPFRTGMRALDIGLGLGKAARAMRASGFEVEGFEPSPPFYAKAMELMGGSAEGFQLASIETAEFAPGSFDFVTFGAVLEHLFDPDAALAKAMLWLRPGGIVHAEIPNRNHLVSRLLNAYYRLIGTNFVTNTSPMHVPFHLYEFDIQSFVHNGRAQGYEVASSWIDTGSIFHVPPVLHPLLRALMARSDTGLQLTVFLRKHET